MKLVRENIEFKRGQKSVTDALDIGLINNIGGINITVYRKKEILRTINLIPFQKYFGNDFQTMKNTLSNYINKLWSNVYKSVIYNEVAKADSIRIEFRDKNNKFFDAKTQAEYKELFDI